MRIWEIHPTGAESVLEQNPRIRRGAEGMPIGPARCPDPEHRRDDESRCPGSPGLREVWPKAPFLAEFPRAARCANPGSKRRKRSVSGSVRRRDRRECDINCHAFVPRRDTPPVFSIPPRDTPKRSVPRSSGWNLPCAPNGARNCAIRKGSPCTFLRQRNPRPGSALSGRVRSPSRPLSPGVWRPGLPGLPPWNRRPAGTSIARRWGPAS